MGASSGVWSTCDAQEVLGAHSAWPWALGAVGVGESPRAGE